VCDCGFFFQAEDGIRDRTVTGVQTCALPILELVVGAEDDRVRAMLASVASEEEIVFVVEIVAIGVAQPIKPDALRPLAADVKARSEERRVGKGGKCGGGGARRKKQASTQGTL